MKKALFAFCRTIGIECVGIAPPGPYHQLEQILLSRLSAGQYSEFAEPELAKRVDPTLTFADTQSVIVCLFPYLGGTVAGANLSKYTYGRDYHLIVKDKLQQIGDYLTSRIDGFAYEAYIDTGPLSDRYVAYLAGLGFYGIHSNLINEKYGSWFFIGYLLNNYPFAPDKPQDRTCVQCGACVRACPGNIILGDFNINPWRCKSYITQKKGDLTADEIGIMNKTGLIFGCDVCQDVCPHNRNVSPTPLAELKSNWVTSLDRDEITPLSNKDFRHRYGDRAFSWRGKKTLLRNMDYVSPVPHPE